MFLAIFDQASRRIALGKRQSQKSRYNHTFGGGEEYLGLASGNRRTPVHLLFRINTDDPFVRVDLGGTKYLPLLCAIRYGACDLGYQVVSDDEIKIFHMEESKEWDGFPRDNYPQTLPIENIGIVSDQYDPSNAEDALFYAGVFGFDHLTGKQMENVRRLVVEKGMYQPGGETIDEFLEMVSMPFVQGPPVDDCPNPDCENHGRESSLRTLAIFNEAPDRAGGLWGSMADLQIIHQICPCCATIRTTSQCT